MINSSYFDLHYLSSVSYVCALPKGGVDRMQFINGLMGLDCIVKWTSTYYEILKIITHH